LHEIKAKEQEIVKS